MPTGTAARASTADGTAGTQVAQATSEVAGSGIVQTMVQEGNKSTYTDINRATITVVDSATDLSSSGFGVSLLTIGNALNISVRCTCDTPSKTLAGQVIFYDSSGNALSKSEGLSFTSDATLRITATGDYICQRTLMDVGQAVKARFFVTSVSGGSWTIYTRPI